MLLRRVFRCFSKVRSLRELAYLSDSKVDPGRTLQQLSKEPNLLSFHVALQSVYNQMLENKHEPQHIQQIAQFIKRGPAESRRAAVQIFLCKYMPCQPSPFLKQLFFTELKTYFEREKLIPLKMFYLVLDTCIRMLFGFAENLDKQGEEEVELVKEAFKVFIVRFSDNLKEFDLKTKIKVVRIAKSLRVYNHELMDNIKLYVQQNQRMMAFEDILLIMVYLEDYKAMPYEFFYDNRQRWFQMIDCYDGCLLRKSEGNLLRMFEIVAKGKLVYTADLLQKIIKLVSGNLRQFSAQQLIRVLFYYSKTKYKDLSLIGESINLIRKDIKSLTLRNMKYLLVAMGNRRFDEIEFLREIKSNEYFWRSLEECTREMQSNKDYFTALVQILSQPASSSQDLKPVLKPNTVSQESV